MDGFKERFWISQKNTALDDMHACQDVIARPTAQGVGAAAARELVGIGRAHQALDAGQGVRARAARGLGCRGGQADRDAARA